jgi:putative transposase
MREREKLVEAHARGAHTVTQLAAAFGISRKTAHKWLQRAGSPGGLADRSRAPHRRPNDTPGAVVAAVLREKVAHPTWGPLKLRPRADDPPELVAAWPAPSTRGAILARAGLSQRRRRRRHVPPTRHSFSACDQPNAVWCADFKGWFRNGDGRRCDPLTITDAYSRMLLCCQGLPRPDYTHVRPFFEAAFREYGLPVGIRTDNGPPFASVGVGGLSPLAVWWVKLGILPERIMPGHPEQNGRHERMHRTLKAECCSPPAANASLQQARFDAFVYEYNWDRPHQALDQQPPASCYWPSPRSYPTVLEDPIYSTDVAVRRVRSNGQIKWRGGRIFVSEALVGEAVGISETLLGHDVYFGPILLGRLNAAGESLIRP